MYESTKSVRTRRDDLIFPEASYKILGALFGVWTEIGSGHKEKIYQKASAMAFQNAGLKVQEQVPVKVLYNSKPVGLYYLDFLLEDMIIVELKVRSFFSKKDIEQIHSYLKALNLKLGILAFFSPSGVKYKRILNLE